MFTKLATRQSTMAAVSKMAFRSSTVAASATSKKPSIGDAVTILQSKVSQINQVVSALLPPRTAPKIGPARFCNYKAWRLTRCFVE